MNDNADSAARTGADPFRGKILCSDIGEVLFDYMTHELGEARSLLVREHLRKCETCQARAAEIQATLDLLAGASVGRRAVPERLSDAHHARLLRALTHPLLDWIYTHHVLISVLTAALVLAATLLGLRRYRAWLRSRPDPGIPVTIQRTDPAEPQDTRTLPD